jgi:hypothetical protein
MYVCMYVCMYVYVYVCKRNIYTSFFLLSGLGINFSLFLNKFSLSYSLTHLKSN